MDDDGLEAAGARLAGIVRPPTGSIPALHPLGAWPPPLPKKSRVDANALLTLNAECQRTVREQLEAIDRASAP